MNTVNDIETTKLIKEPKVKDTKVKESKVKEVKVKEPKIKEVKVKEPKVKEVKVKEPKIKEVKVKEVKVKEPKVKEVKVKEVKVKEVKVKEIVVKKYPCDHCQSELSRGDSLTRHKRSCRSLKTHLSNEKIRAEYNIKMSEMEQQYKDKIVAMERAMEIEREITNKLKIKSGKQYIAQTVAQSVA